MTDPFRKSAEYRTLAASNREAIEAYNQHMLALLFTVGAVMMIIPLASVPFSKTKGPLVPLYIAVIICFALLALVAKLPALKRYTLLALYIGFSIFFISSIYLSVFHSPHTRATILIGVLCLVPLSFIDRPLRMNLFIAFWVILHTILAVVFKPRYAFDDAVNTFAFAILGCFFGNHTILIQVRGYEIQRLLTIEGETDSLTGLYNRRKLFETLENRKTAISGIFMIDIDLFKNYNEQYGHLKADEAMKALARTLQAEEMITFYRYGGEEFVGLCPQGLTKEELHARAEALREAIAEMHLDGPPNTVSIGVALSGDTERLSYESIIEHADRAVFAAKQQGRNRVVIDSA